MTLRRPMLRTLLLLALGVPACASSRKDAAQTPSARAPETIPSDAKGRDASVQDASMQDAPTAHVEVPPVFSQGARIEALEFSRYTTDKGRHLASISTQLGPLARVCDLTPFQGKLYAALANRPLGSDGAMIVAFDPRTDVEESLTTAFNWNRAGEPTKGGGGGQGFLRITAIDGRLYVPDADPPYGGLGVVDHGTEGYVFHSDEAGIFPAPRAPHYRLPNGAAVLPRAYHVLDVASYRGHLYASTGSVPPNEAAWVGSAPGALHVANNDGSRWTFALGYPRVENPKKGRSLYQDGVWRLTYMAVFKDALYAGIQDYDGRSPADFLRIAPPSDRETLQDDDAKPVRVTELGAAYTLRWYADPNGKYLYWIAGTRDGDVRLRRTEDGISWQDLELPSTLGRPTAVVRREGALLVLGEEGVAALDDGAKEGRMIAELPPELRDKGAKGKPGKSPFAITDILCGSPIAVLDGRVYLGSASGGKSRLFTLTPRNP